MQRIQLEHHTRDRLPLHVALQRWQPGWDAPVHVHDALEAIYVVRGSATHVIGGQPYATVAGDLCVVPVGETHQIREPHGLELFNCLYGPSLFTAAEREELAQVPDLTAFFFARGVVARRRSFAPPARRQLTEALAAVAEEFALRAPGWRLAAKAGFARVLIDACRLPRRDAGPDRDVGVTVALRRLHADPAARHTVAGLAARARLSPDRFGARFRSHTGLSLHAYLRRLRIGLAQVALAHGDAPVTTIALEYGFADGAHFARAFARETGETPSVYRRRRCGS